MRAIALPSNVPAELIGRRPDLVAQRWRIEAAQQDIAYAKAQFYPNVNLAAFVGFQSLGSAGFLSAASRTLGIGPAVTLPIFEGGRLRAQPRRHERRLRHRRRAVQPDAGRRAARRRRPARVAGAASTSSARSRSRRSPTAQEAYDLALLRYREGLGNLPAGAVASSRRCSRSRASTRSCARASSTFAINLVRALGGGFDAATPPLAGSLKHRHNEGITMAEQSNPTPATPATPAATLGDKRKRWLAIVVAASSRSRSPMARTGPIDLRYKQSTDDAYVNGNVVQITPQISGTVVVDRRRRHAVREGRPDAGAARPGRREGRARPGRSAARAGPCARCAASSPRPRSSRRPSKCARPRSSARSDDLARRERLAASGARLRRRAAARARRARRAEAALLARAAGARRPTARASTARRSRTIPTCRTQRRRCARPTWRTARTALPAPVSRLRRQAHRCSSASASDPGAPLMAIVPLDQVWVDANFKEPQLADDARRPAGRAHRRPLRQQGRRITARSRASAPAPARRSRCCRRRTRPATGSRSCSACRCASRSIRRSWPRIRCRSACRCRSRSTPRSATASACRASRRLRRRTRPTCSDPLDAHAPTTRVSPIIAANGGSRRAARARRRRTQPRRTATVTAAGRARHRDQGRRGGTRSRAVAAAFVRSMADEANDVRRLHRSRRLRRRPAADRQRARAGQRSRCRSRRS